jgi:hypothetical protein
MILFHSDICVDFLGTHMISLVLFFRKPGVTSSQQHDMRCGYLGSYIFSNDEHC